MPGYEQYIRMAPLIRSAIGGAAQGFGGRGRREWRDLGGGRQVIRVRERWQALSVDVATKQMTEAPGAAAQQQGGRGGRGGGGQPARGRQFDFAIAPAGNHRAIYKDRNVWVGDSTGAGAVQITTDGSEKGRIKYGTGSWVYGEELGQTHGDVVVARRQRSSPTIASTRARFRTSISRRI